MSRKALHDLPGLANRLADDVRRRGLAPGDRYLSAVAAGKMLGVSRATADRVLTQLVRRSLLVRRHKSGTFIGPALKTMSVPTERTVHLLLPHDWTFPSGLGEFVASILAAQPDAGVRVARVPESERGDFLRNLVHLAHATEFAGFLVASSHRDVYEFLADKRLPAVILGTPYQANFPIPSIDQDNAAQARQLTQYLLQRGHRRILLLAELPGRPGSTHFLDAVHEVLGHAGHAAASLAIRFASEDHDALSVDIHDLLASPTPPTGIITTRLSLAMRARQAVRDNSPRLAKKVDIVVQNSGDAIDPSFTHSRPALSAGAKIARAVAILQQVLAGKKPQPLHVTLPVEMYLADTTQ